MAVTLAQAKPLCTASELELVRASMKRSTSDMSPAQLRQKLTRARRLRDKFRDLGDRQRRESRGKQEARGSRPASGNRGSRLKQQLFSETVERLEQALQQAEATANGSKPRRKTASRVAKKTVKKASRKTAGAGSTAAKAGRKTSKKATGKKAAATSTKKTSKKTRKKTAKKATRKKASSLRASAGAASSAGRRKPVKSSRSAASARNESLQSVSEQSIGARKAGRLDRAGRPRLRGHVSARTRRAQARRDSR